MWVTLEKIKITELEGFHDDKGSRRIKTKINWNFRKLKIERVTHKENCQFKRRQAIPWITDIEFVFRNPNEKKWITLSQRTMEVFWGNESESQR